MRTNISAMCILALCSHFSSRFPFFMIHNRAARKASNLWRTLPPFPREMAIEYSMPPYERSGISVAGVPSRYMPKNNVLPELSAEVVAGVWQHSSWSGNNVVFFRC